MIIKLGKVISEYSVRNKADEDIPVYSVTNDKGFCTNYFSKDVSSKDRTTYKIVPYGYFAYNPSRINVGSVDWQHYEKKVIVSPLYVVFYVDEVIDQRYLLHYLKSDITLKFIKSNSAGSVRDNLKLSVLQEFSINLRTKEEQYKIVNILDKVDLLISLYTEKLKKFDELTKSLFIEMFGDPISNPKEWKKKKCKNILTKIGSGATPQGGSESYKEEGISLIRSMNVHNGRFESKDLAYIDEKQAQKLDNVNIKENDVLINITGASVARCCIVPSDVIPARVNQHVSVLRCSDMVNSIFLCYQIINDSYQNLLKKIGTSGGATREAITKKQIEDLEVILPPIELQNKFANFVRGTDKSKLAVKKSLEELEILKKSLMQKYFA